ncbi:HD-like signal output (HDOD) domain, no enzymatic activity [Amphritea atlantica]|uniref:HD-like signal output (HDOD) domain, no enzymatic activity n=1 Tax=Amphritea atlantica TaxID=355243 RepID=A0A1H9FTJ1_9GAMM|nr:HDOD domain-containing protein [Amphritea atlantica]SEQ41196.1 HD-like signal output (HDOD) domain, no enzymatic activity [Amphritea atlantica]
MEVSELLQQTHKLPNVPDVVRELILQLNNPKADYGVIAEKVIHDQTLSLKLLRLVNSAHFGLSRKVTSINEAIIMLGMAQLKTMVIASGFAGSVKQVEGLDIKQFWAESFQVAALAKWLAEKSTAVDPDTAFTVGLIHNIGRLLLHLTKPKLAEAIQKLVDETDCDRSEAERVRLNFTTAEAGEALLRYWQFPASLSEAVRYHKQPFDADPPTPLSAIVNIACYINTCMRKKLTTEEVIAMFPAAEAELAGLPPHSASISEDAMQLQSGLEVLI